jgi:hypothetical protein
MERSESYGSASRGTRIFVDDILEQIARGERIMEGIQFVIDDNGNKKAVLIDLEKWGDLWEDFYDVLVSELRRDEPRVAWGELKAEMMEEGKSIKDV